MEKIRVYGEAQLERSMDNSCLNVVIYYGDDNKSERLLDHIAALEQRGGFDNVKILLVSISRLPKLYYQRRGISLTPTVAYFINGVEQSRMTGLHTLDMLASNIGRNLKKLQMAA